ncbi:MAG: radical SAM protein [candidate division WOR-3 bacterium]|nr:radical SAM protein [candidate division WOR-3 bacterium]
MTKARFLLVNPWIYDFKAYDFWMKPLGLLYVASILRNAGYEIDYIDCLDRYQPELLKNISKLPKVDEFGRGKFYSQEIEKPEPYKNIERRYKRYGLPIELLDDVLSKMRKPDGIFVTSVMTYWYPGVFDAIKTLKRHFPNTPIVLGGIYATLCYEHAQKFSHADYVLPGPIDKTLNQIMPGIKPFNFTEYPLPAFDLYPRLDYTCILTSQGCPFRCVYCVVPELYPKYIYRSIASVINEIEYYISLGVKNIAFYDDALLANPNFKKILDEIITRKMNVNFHTPNGLHPRLLTQEIADKMFQAGFKTIYLSLETTDMKIHQEIDDKVTAEEFVRAVEYLKNSGFSESQLHCYLLIGLPELTSEQIIKSIDFVYSFGVSAHLAEFSPIPNSPIYKQLGFDKNTDPLYHNNIIFPVLNKKQQQEMQEIKKYLSLIRTKFN